jgi:endo-1,4-beta-mannosidase
LTFIPNPASQTLLKAFLKALYSDEYIPVCEEEFGFFRVTGDLRTKALQAIDDLIVTDGAPEWTFESETSPRTGQSDYVISVKRDSYSEVEQDQNVAEVKALKMTLAELQTEYDAMQTRVDAMSGSSGSISEADALIDEQMDNEETDTQIKIALALAGVSFTLWMLTIIGVIVKYVLHL